MSKIVMLKRTLALVVALGTMTLPSAALAQSSSENAYGGPNSVVLGVQEGGGGPDSPTASPSGNEQAVGNERASAEGSGLPFTGADLGVLVGAGALLVAVGFGLRRLTHRPSAA